MKTKVFFALPLMVFFVMLASASKAQVMPALCKKTSIVVKEASVTCPNGLTILVSSTGYGEAEDVSCYNAQVAAYIMASTEADIKLRNALLYVKCPPTVPEGGGGTQPPGTPNPVTPTF